jgi:hypothetical protein
MGWPTPTEMPGLGKTPAVTDWGAAAVAKLAAPRALSPVPSLTT